MEKGRHLYLIDGSAYVHRAYHAIRGLSTSKGRPTNAVYGFTNMLIKLIEDRSPEYLMMVFDAKGPTFRHQMYDAYKANRPPMPEDLAAQIPDIKSVAEGFGIQMLELQGYEADDVIGTLAKKAEDAGFWTTIVTGDKDFMQLVSERTILWDPMKDRITDRHKLRAEFDIEPRQMIDVMGLTGDTADNVPGVPGIGIKTAVSLIRRFGSMDHVYEQVDRVTGKKQKENLVRHKDMAMLSRELVTIHTDVPVGFDPASCRHPVANREKLSALFRELEFRRLYQAWTVTSDLSEKGYKAILDNDGLNRLTDLIEASRLVSVDTETTSKDPMEARLVGLSFAVKPHEAYYIPCGHDYTGAPYQLPLDAVLDRLRPAFVDASITKIGQNIKYDQIVLRRHGIQIEGIRFDTMLASYLLNPAKRAHSLDQIALDFLDHRMITYKEVTDGLDRDAGFNKVPVEKATPYACEDADIVLLAYDVLEPMLREAGLSDLFSQVEMPLVSVLADMEINGILVDSDILRDLSNAFENQLKTIEEDIYATAGETFNINSSQQLGQILFDKLKLPTQKKTKKRTGYSTDVEVLTALANQHDLPAYILRHRSLAKLKSTYTDALIGLINKDTGRIHTSFNQTITATGRLSSSDPNLQNIPIRTEEGRLIRRAFVPSRDWLMMSADYSQIELRLLAHCSEDEILINAFKEDEDIHSRTAAEVFQIAPTDVGQELRHQAKAINFGIIYGMSPYGLSKQLGITLKMAKTYIDSYFSRYSGVKHFMDEAIRIARETKKTSTLMGRIRPLPEIDSVNRNLRLFAERTAINTPIQGTAADLIKVAMIRASEVLRKEQCRARMLLSVHDELVFEVPRGEVDETASLITEIMENIWQLRVPLKINVACGEHWAEAH